MVQRYDVKDIYVSDHLLVPIFSIITPANSLLSHVFFIYALYIEVSHFTLVNNIV